MKIKTETIVRTVVLALALINQVLSACGKPIIPVEEESVEVFITTGLTIASAVWGFWKNNSFTAKAIIADEYLQELRKGE